MNQLHSIKPAQIWLRNYSMVLLTGRSLWRMRGELRPFVAVRLNLYPRPWFLDAEVELNLFNKLGPTTRSLLPGTQL
jgi:hypothetical protein